MIDREKLKEALVRSLQRGPRYLHGWGARDTHFVKLIDDGRTDLYAAIQIGDYHPTFTMLLINWLKDSWSWVGDETGYD